jgi:hypothetical protein
MASTGHRISQPPIDAPHLLLQVFTHPPFQPVAGKTRQKSLDETHMPTMGAQFERDPGTQLFHPGHNIRGHQRIIHGVQNQCGLNNLFQIIRAATLPVVILRIPETIERCGDSVIEFVDTADLPQRRR